MILLAGTSRRMVFGTSGVAQELWPYKVRSISSGFSLFGCFFFFLKKKLALVLEIGHTIISEAKTTIPYGKCEIHVYYWFMLAEEDK